MSLVSTTFPLPLLIPAIPAIFCAAGAWLLQAWISTHRPAESTAAVRPASVIARLVRIEILPSRTLPGPGRCGRRPGRGPPCERRSLFPLTAPRPGRTPARGLRRPSTADTERRERPALADPRDVPW